MGDNKISEAARFTKRPVTIEAMQFDGSAKSASAICQWANAGDDAAGHDDPTVSYTTMDGDDAGHNMIVWTLEGDMTASPGDWIIKGVKGEFYPCKPDIFDLTYSPHLQGEAVPVAWQYREDACHNGFEDDAWCDCTRELFETLTAIIGNRPFARMARGDGSWREDAGGWPIQARALYLHPQPAELNEVSGDSGELVKDALVRALKLARNRIQRLMLECPHGSSIRDDAGDWAGEATDAINIALAATGKQQVGEVESLPPEMRSSDPRYLDYLDGSKQVGEPKCSDCETPLLYECTGCSATNYPSQQAGDVQGVDLGQFRDCVLVTLRQMPHGSKDRQECQRLLDLIDGRDAGAEVGRG